MAEKNNIFSRLRNLFTNDTIIRRNKRGKLIVKDIDYSQRALTTNFMDKYNRIYSNSRVYGGNKRNKMGSASIRSSIRPMIYREYECISGDTIIPLPDGKKMTMKELAETYPDKSTTFYVYSYDHKTDTIKLGKAHSVRKTKTELTYKVTFDNGEFILATENHPFLMRDGEYKQVHELTENDSVMPLYQKRFYGHKSYRFLYNFSKGWQAEHKIVAEQFHGDVNEGHIVHHVDFQKENNLPDNLKIMTEHDHKHYHCVLINKNIKWAPENRDKQIAAIKLAKSKLPTYSWDGKRSGENNPFYGKSHTTESKLMRSEKHKEWHRLNPDAQQGVKNARYRHDVTIDSILEKSYELLKNDNFKKYELLSELNCDNGVLYDRLESIDISNWYEFRNYIQATLNHKIVSIEPYEVEDVYDMTVDTYHNFATTMCFVHNSMDTDPIIASALDVYSDESTVGDVNGEMLTIKTDDTKMKKILTNLFYDRLNITFNLWSWIRNLTKYGDFFLRLNIVDKNGVVGVEPMSPYEIERVEDSDPENPNLVIFTYMDDTTSVLTKKSAEELQNYEVAHFRLMSDSNYLPYGKSMIEGGRKIWKQLTLMEDAMLIQRIMRAPERRIFKVDVGNLEPNKIDAFMKKFIAKTKKIPVIDQATGDYNLKFNVDSVMDDYYLPVRGSDSGTDVDTLAGLSNDGAIDDIEYLRNKMMASLKIPKAFLGYEESLSSKSTLAAEDVRFSRTIERIQKIVTAELTKVAIIHLYTQGYDDGDLLNFELLLTNPSTIHEQEKLEILERKLDIATSALESNLLSKDWVYDKIFGFSDDERTNLTDQIIDDLKEKFRQEQIEQGGNDPAYSGEKVDTKEEEEEWGGSEKGPEYDNTDTGEELGSNDNKNAMKNSDKFGSREFKKGSPLGLSAGYKKSRNKSLLSMLEKEFTTKDKDTSILSEDALLNEKNEKNK